MEQGLISDGTILGGLAVVISLGLSGFGLYRNYKLDRDTASKSQFDTVVENYRTLLNKSELTIARLEAKLAEQDQLLNRYSTEIATYKLELDRKNKEIKELKGRVLKLEKRDA